jgi:hypothetical protein
MVSGARLRGDLPGVARLSCTRGLFWHENVRGIDLARHCDLKSETEASCHFCAHDQGFAAEHTVPVFLSRLHV